MSQGWLKLYHRDQKKVMRAVDGIAFLPNGYLRLDKSVYTYEMETDEFVFMKVIK